mmetsp:Transcript_50489/g.114676  ORF Transcript_50489/g.114676 Transcript_50489/m.114676 type:complete len:220 (-) Transcript_50489:56-715(-)
MPLGEQHNLTLELVLRHGTFLVKIGELLCAGFAAVRIQPLDQFVRHLAAILIICFQPSSFLLAGMARGLDTIFQDRRRWRKGQGQGRLGGRQVRPELIWAVCKTAILTIRTIVIFTARSLVRLATAKVIEPVGEGTLCSQVAAPVLVMPAKHNLAPLATTEFRQLVGEAALGSVGARPRQVGTPLPLALHCLLTTHLGGSTTNNVESHLAWMYCTVVEH